MYDSMYKDEMENDIEIPSSIFNSEGIDIQKRIILGAIARTWELVLHRQTPDFEALAKLLDVRYNNSKDDVEHEDIFAGV